MTDPPHAHLVSPTHATILDRSGRFEARVDGTPIVVAAPSPAEAAAFAADVRDADTKRDGHLWTEALTIDIALRWLEVEQARRLLAALSGRDVGRVTVHSPRRRLWAAVQGHVDVQVLLPATQQLRTAAADLSGGGRGHLLKYAGLDTLLRQAGALHRARTTLPDGRWLGVLEVPTPSMSDNLLAVAEHLGGAILACDPRAFPLAEGRTVAVDNLWRHRADRTATSPGPAVRAALRAVDPTFDAAVGAGLARTAGRLARDLTRMRRALQAARPSRLVLSSDQHRYGVLATWLGRELGIPTTVIQHGFVDHPLAYLPVRADLVAAIGPDSRDWFVRHGTDPSRVVATGSPRFPELAAPRSAPPHRLLMPLNATMQQLGPGFVGAARGGAAACAEPATVVLRPHPGEREVAALGVEALLQHLGCPEAPAGVEVDPHDAIAESLATTDAVLVWDSSVAYEALCLGIPVLLYAPSEGPVNPLAHTGLPTFADSRELGHLLTDHWATTVTASLACRERMVTAGGRGAIDNIVSAVRA